MNGKYNIPKPKNEPILEYLPGSKERAELKRTLKKIKEPFEIPLIINGQEVKTAVLAKAVTPHNHNYILSTYHMAQENEVDLAINAALETQDSWEQMDWFDRASIFLKAAELLAGPYRQTLNAATMLGISKNVYQAEIDVVELIDFLRFNAYYMQQIYENQPFSSKGVLNRMEFRPLEGFVFAVTPFNFISIAGNLPTSPALMGNTVVWKPASSAVYPAYYIMRLLLDAGLPPGVINFIPGSGSKIGDLILSHPALAGVHFTGSTSVFQSIWRTIGTNISNYKTYPRIVGETGGKDFVFAHSSADVVELATALIRGAFQYSGQKCSAASRTYIPESLWPQLKEKMDEFLTEIKSGDVEDFSNFVTSIIDQSSFKKIVTYVDYAKESKDIEIIHGGDYSEEKGYFISPTVVKVQNPKDKIMQEEIFGPVLSIYVYPDEEYEKTLELCNETSPYGLTGSIFAKERTAIKKAEEKLRHAAGNYYINAKPTGAVVGQQPFGGSRASGTNDKAGSFLNLLRWTSARSIKEDLVPPRHPLYEYMKEN